MVKEIQVTQLLRRIRAGEDSAIKELYRQYRRPVVGTLYKEFGNRFEISVLVEEFQESVTILYEKIMLNPDFEITSSITSYLVRIGRNRLYSRNRHTQRWPTFSQLGYEPESHVIHDSVISPGPGNHASLLEETFRAIDENLSPVGVEVLEMFYLEGKSYEAIAQILRPRYPELAMNPDSLKAYKYRTIRKLRDWFRQTGTSYHDG